MINFVFDNLEEGTNCVKQAGLNKGGSNRFTFSTYYEQNVFITK